MGAGAGEEGELGVVVVVAVVVIIVNAPKFIHRQKTIQTPV